jgi:hypothetical protein
VVSHPSTPGSLAFSTSEGRTDRPVSPWERTSEMLLSNFACSSGVCACARADYLAF